MTASRLTRLLAALVVVAAMAAIYSWRLHDSPVYLTADEIIIGLDAHSIATTGHDLRGRWLPLYFQIDEFRVKGTIWYQPAIMYFTALVLKFAPLTEWSIRLPAVIVGLVDIILMFLVARALYGTVAIGAIAAALLFLTPAHFIHSRFAMDYIFPVPFILAWLLALVAYERRRDPRLLFVATLCLGLGFYSYIAAIMLMGIYAVLTLLLLRQTGASRSAAILALAGFAVPLLAFAAWVATHPNVVAETFARYEFGNPHRLGPVQRLELYWEYFSPSYLFFNGGSEQMFSPRTTGVFLLPMALLLPYGIYRAIRNPTAIGNVLLLGFVSAPLAAILLDEGSSINRALEVLPFAVLLAAGGIAYLWAAVPARLSRTAILMPGVAAIMLGAGLAAWTVGTSGRLSGSALPLIIAGLALCVLSRVGTPVQLWRFAVVVMLGLGALQFRGFLVDYFGDYRVRSAPLFQGNIETAIVEILDRERAGSAPPVFLSKGLDLWWRYYVKKYGRADLADRFTAFEHLEQATVPPGGLVLVNIQTSDGVAIATSLSAVGGLHLIRTVEDIDGTKSFAVLQQ